MARVSSEEKVLVYRRGRTIYFFDEVQASSVCEAIRLLQEIESEKSSSKPIQIVIKSEGGDCYDCLALYDTIRRSEYHIETVGTGLIASAATIIFLAGDERFLTENTRVMVHQPSTEVEGKASDVEIDVIETKNLANIFNDIISDRTGQNLNKIRKEMKSGDKWLSASEAVDEGYADKVIMNKKTPRRRRKRPQKS